MRDTAVRDFQTMDRLTCRTAAHGIYAIAIAGDCGRLPIGFRRAGNGGRATQAAAAPIAAPVSPNAMPMEIPAAESWQSDSQQDTGWPQLPSAPTGDQRNATPTQWGGTALNQQTELPPTAATSNPCFPADSAPSTERVFAVNNADAPRVDGGRDRAIVPADAVSAPEAVGDDTNAPALLPWGPSTPSPELDAVNQRAEQTVRWAFNRAERGALYSARAQFAEALRSIAEALDVQRNTAAHTRALSAGLRALDEVNDFVPRDVRSQADMNLKLMVDAHHTPVLKNRSLEEVTLATAQRDVFDLRAGAIGRGGGRSIGFITGVVRPRKSLHRARGVARSARKVGRRQGGGVLSIGINRRHAKLHGRQRAGRAPDEIRPLGRCPQCPGACRSGFRHADFMAQLSRGVRPDGRSSRKRWRLGIRPILLWPNCKKPDAKRPIRNTPSKWSTPKPLPKCTPRSPTLRAKTLSPDRRQRRHNNRRYRPPPSQAKRADSGRGVGNEVFAMKQGQKNEAIGSAPPRQTQIHSVQWICWLAVVLALVGAADMIWDAVAEERPASMPAAEPATKSIAHPIAAPVRALIIQHVGEIQLCQALGPAAPCPIMGVDCFANGPCSGKCGDCRWGAMGPINWQAYAQGEYVGHWREPHVPVYRLRVDDQLDCVYRITRDVQPDAYRLECWRYCGRAIVHRRKNQSRSGGPGGWNHHVVVPRRSARRRPHGERAARIARPVVLEVLQAARDHGHPGQSEYEADRFAQHRRQPGGGWRTTNAVESYAARHDRLAGLNDIPAQGLTLGELKEEIRLRYKDELGIEGIEVTPILSQRAAAICVCVRRSEHTRPVHDGRPHHADASHQPGGQLESRSELAADRRFPPRRRLAADGHLGSHAKHDAVQPSALPGRRNLARRQRYCDGSQIADSDRRRFDQPVFHQGPVLRAAVQHVLLVQPGGDGGELKERKV